MLHKQISQITSSEEMLPSLETFENALIAARMPRPAVVNGTVSGIDLFIGSAGIDPEQAIRIPVKYSKATMKARPPSLSKAWKPAMDLQNPLQPKADRSSQARASQLMWSIAQQSLSNEGVNPSDIAAMISADVKHHSTYVIKHAPHDAAGETQTLSQTQASQRSLMPDYGNEGLDGDNVDEEQEQAEVEDEEEEVVAKEDIVKAWRFGSTWVPMEADTFEPLETQKGVEVLGFIPQENVIDSFLSLGEVADDDTAQTASSHGRSPVHLAGSDVAQGANPVLFAGRRDAPERDVCSGALGSQGSGGTCDWCLRAGLWVPGRRQAAGFHVLDQGGIITWRL
jgi:ATP-dependent DNA helicase 2 subunit 2